MEEKEISDVQMPEVKEPTITFRSETDRVVRQIVNAKINEPLIEISGYGLAINFNMKYLKSIEDIDAACEGVSKLFREIILSQLLDDDVQSKKQKE